MSGTSRTFEAEILSARGGGALVEVPFSVESAFGARGQVKVRATFDGHEYRGSLAPMGGGVHVLGVRKDVRAAIGKDVGDRVRVTLDHDDEPRTVDVPLELRSSFADAPDARERFETLSYTHRRELAEWIAEGKKPETRQRRAVKAIEMLRAGETR